MGVFSNSNNLRRLKPFAIKLALVNAQRGSILEAHGVLTDCVKSFCGDAAFEAVQSLPRPKQLSVFELLYVDLRLLRNHIFCVTPRTAIDISSVAIPQIFSALLSSDATSSDGVLEAVQQLASQFGSLNPIVNGFGPVQQSQFCDALAIVTCVLRIRCVGNPAALGDLIQWCSFAIDRSGDLAPKLDAPEKAGFACIASHACLILLLVPFMPASTRSHVPPKWLTGDYQVGLVQHMLQWNSNKSGQASLDCASSLLVYVLRESPNTATAEDVSTAVAGYEQLITSKAFSVDNIIRNNNTNNPVHLGECAHHQLLQGKGWAAHKLALRSFELFTVHCSLFGGMTQHRSISDERRATPRSTNELLLVLVLLLLVVVVVVVVWLVVGVVWLVVGLVVRWFGCKFGCLGVRRAGCKFGCLVVRWCGCQFGCLVVRWVVPSFLRPFVLRSCSLNSTTPSFWCQQNTLAG